MNTKSDETGVAVRRALLGNEHYENSMRNQTGLDREWQTFLNNQVFGRTWARGILEHRQLSLINLGMLAGLGRMEEFELHFKIALNVTKVPLIQLREILLHIGMYCGVPIGRDCFAIARRILKEEGTDLSVLDEAD
jgi:alkylhydroperoxidase/carboxymuconolactone decarboxylase family protein YurZ